jgi:hypothetical protein
MAAQRGGRRPGAGRKPGEPTKKTKALKELAEKAAAEGITPLEVMIQAMREAFDKGGAVAAFPFAKDAAPYMHAKISAVELSGPNGGPVAHETTHLTPEKVQEGLENGLGKIVSPS